MKSPRMSELLNLPVDERPTVMPASPHQFCICISFLYGLSYFSPFRTYFLYLFPVKKCTEVAKANPVHFYRKLVLAPSSDRLKPARWGNIFCDNIWFSAATIVWNNPDKASPLRKPANYLAERDFYFHCKVSLSLHLYFRNIRLNIRQTITPATPMIAKSIAAPAPLVSPKIDTSGLPAGCAAISGSKTLSTSAPPSKKPMGWWKTARYCGRNTLSPAFQVGYCFCK